MSFTGHIQGIARNVVIDAASYDGHIGLVIAFFTLVGGQTARYQEVEFGNRLSEDKRDVLYKNHDKTMDFKVENSVIVDFSICDGH